MNQIKPYLPWILRIFLSFVFIFSAYAKLYPSAYFAITTFEMKQLVPLGFSECLAPYFSRFIIGAEFALGIGFLQPHFLRKLILPLSALLLVIFNIHLAYSILNDIGGNCGCFGDLLPMTPLQAFIKNIVILALIIWLWKLIKASDQQIKHNFFIPVSIALGSILILFVLIPFCPCESTTNENLNENTTGNLVIIDDEPEVVQQHIDTSKTKVHNSENSNTSSTNGQDLEPKNEYQPPKVKSGFEKYAPNIDEGKKLLLFFAPGCEHCQDAAKTLVAMSKKEKDFPKMFIIFMDEEPEKIPDFFEKAGKKISHTILEVGAFWGVIGPKRDTPGILYLWNGNQVVFFDGTTENAFEEDKLKKALARKKL